jgi:hypothetical protein
MFVMPVTWVLLISGIEFQRFPTERDCRAVVEHILVRLPATCVPVSPQPVDMVEHILQLVH